MIKKNQNSINPFLKSYYRRGASVLTAEQIEEIRGVKDKVPVYRIVRDYHICKERVLDIWEGCERLQQNNYDLMGVAPKIRDTENHIINSIDSPANSDGLIKKRKIKKTVHIENNTIGNTQSIANNNSLVPKQYIPEKMSVEELDAYNKREVEMDKKAIASARRILGS